VIDVVEILQHWHAGRPKSVVASSLGVDPKTVRKYVAPAEDAGMAPGDRPVGRDEWAALVTEWFPELTDAQARSLTAPGIEAHRERIKAMLETNTVSTVWQRLRDEAGLAVSLTSFRRWVWRELPATADPDRVRPLRPDVPAGDEAQVDYGFLGTWADPVTNRARRMWAFVMVLACSRHMFVRPVVTMDQAAWTAAHVAAFEFFGGVPARVVPDNLKTGVDRPDLYDPKLNRSYGELAEHYGLLIDPARASKPRDKARVERQMPYVRDSFWRGRDWAGIDDMQTAAVEWCTAVAGRRSHRSLDGAAPLTVFNAVEAPALRVLPPRPFELAHWSTATVGPDCHIRAGRTLYSVPWRHIGAVVDVRATDRIIQIHRDGEVVKTHPLVERGRHTDWDDYPPEKVAFFMRTPAWCRRRASELGVNVTMVVAGLLEGGALHRLRAAQGVIGLAERPNVGAARLDAACARAQAVGDPSYRTIKGILAAGTETDSEEPSARGAAPAAPAHLHGPLRLFQHLDSEPGDGVACEGVAG
jgi:transposase